MKLTPVIAAVCAVLAILVLASIFAGCSGSRPFGRPGVVLHAINQG